MLLNDDLEFFSDVWYGFIFGVVIAAWLVLLFG